MRGFRGSRAAQNETAHRFGRRNPGVQYAYRGRFNQHGQNTQQRAPLPDWVKTPENKAESSPQLAKPAVERPALRLAVDNTAKKKAAAKTKPAAKSTRARPAAAKAKPAAKKKTTARKTGTTKRAATKRRAA